jgi:hypothetical protein
MGPITPTFTFLSIPELGPECENCGRPEDKWDCPCGCGMVVCGRCFRNVERNLLRRKMGWSQWAPCDGVDDVVDGLLAAGAVSVEILWRNVHDGQLRAIVADEPPAGGWHLSISHAKRGKNGELTPGRYPTWGEIADARYTLCPDDIDMVMHLPPPSEYVAFHDTTLHLYEHPPRSTDG